MSTNSTSEPFHNSRQPAPTHPRRRRMFPALPKAAFTQAYETWCKKHSIDLETSISGQPVDMHRLHIEILSAASVEQISRQDQWRGIAGRLGFIDPEATAMSGTGNPMSSGAVADELRRFYKSHLQEFDAVYLGSVLSSVHGRQALVVHPE